MLQELTGGTLDTSKKGKSNTRSYVTFKCARAHLNSVPVAGNPISAPF